MAKKTITVEYSTWFIVQIDVDDPNDRAAVWKAVNEARHKSEEIPGLSCVEKVYDENVSEDDYIFDSDEDGTY